MTSIKEQSFDNVAQNYPKKKLESIAYGTAGFRTKAENLDHILFRMGLLAALRSRAKKSSAIGLMITASHNPEPDNGVKLVDPQGEMLEQKWEGIATELANVENDKLQEQLSKIVKSAGINLDKSAVVFIGRDTRPSSFRLSQAAIAGAKLSNAVVIDHGIVSTPMLHYYVALHNSGFVGPQSLKEEYFSKLANSFQALRPEEVCNKNYINELDFDGANGVGALVMQSFMSYLGDSLKVNIYNKDTNSLGKLNHLCGADFVKTNQKPPEGVEIVHNRRCVAVDGDADRIVYFYVDKNNFFHLLDGDRIAILVASYLMDLVRESDISLKLGLVQTAYANGNSTRYISDTLKVPVVCTLTGVKHLHHKALEFDIGVYFEANGHGTVLFSQNAKKKITEASKNNLLEHKKRKTIARLQKVVEVINETVGDAISDMFLVETVLHSRGWSIQDWEAQYTDLPSRLLKVTIKDRNDIQTTDAERKCVKPVGLQNEIDELAGRVQFGRSFVRPSGTEDIVRVYAEAATQGEADELASSVARIVFQMAGGIGDSP